MVPPRNGLSKRLPNTLSRRGGCTATGTATCSFTTTTGCSASINSRIRMRSFFVATRRSQMAKSSWALCNSPLRVNTVLDCACILARRVSTSPSGPLATGTREEDCAFGRAGSLAAGVTGEATGVNLENKENTTGAGGVPAK